MWSVGGDWFVTDGVMGSDRRWVSHMSLVFLRHSVIGFVLSEEQWFRLYLTQPLPSPITNHTVTLHLSCLTKLKH